MKILRKKKLKTAYLFQRRQESPTLPNPDIEIFISLFSLPEHRTGGSITCWFPQLLRSQLLLQDLNHNLSEAMASPHYGIDANVLIACATAIFAALIYGEEVVLEFYGFFRSFCTSTRQNSNSYHYFFPCSHHEPEAWQES